MREERVRGEGGGGKGDVDEIMRKRTKWEGRGKKMMRKSMRERKGMGGLGEEEDRPEKINQQSSS